MTGQLAVDASAADALFTVTEAIEASTPIPLWVVEVNELMLFTYGGSSPGAADWWAETSGRPGIAKRIHYLLITPAGAQLYIACDDEEEARWLAGVLHAHGVHPKVAVVRRLGRAITCARCTTRAPFWKGVEAVGPMCRPCFREWADWTRPTGAAVSSRRAET